MLLASICCCCSCERGFRITEVCGGFSCLGALGSGPGLLWSSCYLGLPSPKRVTGSTAHPWAPHWQQTPTSPSSGASFLTTQNHSHPSLPAFHCISHPPITVSPSHSHSYILFPTHYCLWDDAVRSPSDRTDESLKEEKKTHTHTHSALVTL